MPLALYWSLTRGLLGCYIMLWDFVVVRRMSSEKKGAGSFHSRPAITPAYHEMRGHLLYIIALQRWRGDTITLMSNTIRRYIKYRVCMTTCMNSRRGVWGGYSYTNTFTSLSLSSPLPLPSSLSLYILHSQITLFPLGLHNFLWL